MPRPPLDAMRILAVSRFGAGPLGTQRLAGLGADIITIEGVPLLRARLVTRTTAEWLDRLRARVPCAPVNDVRQALADEQVQAREMIVEIEYPEFGRLREVRSPISHRTEGEIRPPARAPRLGEHTDEILRDTLGDSDTTIRRLRADGVIG